MCVEFKSQTSYMRQASIPLPIAYNQFVPLNFRTIFQSHNLGYMCLFWAYNIPFLTLQRDELNPKSFMPFYHPVKQKIYLNLNATCTCRIVAHNHSMCDIHINVSYIHFIIFCSV